MINTGMKITDLYALLRICFKNWNFRGVFSILYNIDFAGRNCEAAMARWEGGGGRGKDYSF
jgi:hypothetical protein